MKKICHVLIAYGIKNQNYTTQLLDGLNNLSSNYHFVYCHAKLSENETLDIIKSKSLSRFKSLLIFTKLYFKDRNFKFLYKKLGYYRLYKWLLLINLNIDVLHIHHLHAVPSEIISYLKNKDVKLVASLRGNDLLIKTNNKSIKNDVYFKLNSMSTIHTISNYMASELKSRFELSSEIIYRGIQMPKDQNLKKTNYISNTIRAIAVGRLVWEKGHIYLIESINRLVKKGHDIKLDIYGDGPLLESLNFRIVQLGLKKHIILKGFVENKKLKSIYKNYNLAIQPSLSEALSNGLIDLMIHDLPCLVSNVGGMKEVIIHGKNGFVFNILNPNEIDDYIFESINIDFRKLKEFNDSHKKKFDVKTEIKNLESLYTK